MTEELSVGLDKVRFNTVEVCIGQVLEDCDVFGLSDLGSEGSPSDAGYGTCWKSLDNS